MAKIYYSTQPVWWNTGNEIKPNRAAFNKFTFTPADNFNISWVDEMTISVIVPNNNLCTLLKIEDNIDNITKYFYLLEVVNRTNVNQECVYELDVWLTYLLPYLESTKSTNTIKSIRTLDVSTLANTVNIEPIGVPTGNIGMENFYSSYLTNTDANFYRASGKETAFDDLLKPIPGVSTNVYYVFKAKNNVADKFYGSLWRFIASKCETSLPNYILIPVLDIAALGLVVDIDYMHTTGVSVSGEVSYQTRTATHTVLNSKHNLNELVRVVADFGDFNGLGDFLGVWVGPNFFRFKTSGMKWPMVMEIDTNHFVFDIYNTTNILFRPDDNRHKFNKYGANTEWCTFLALRMSSLPLELVPLLDKSQYGYLLQGLKYQENTDSNIVVNATGVSFNNSFSYSNGLQTTTINIALPVANDTYYNLLAAQRNTLNTSLNLSLLNSALTGLSPLPGLVPPEPRTRNSTRTETRDYQGPRYEVGNNKVRITKPGKRGGEKHMGWKTTYTTALPKVQKLSKTTNYTSTVSGGFRYGNMLSSVLGVASAGAQFISTLAQQNAYKADLRIATSSAVLNENDRYLNWYKIASRIPGLTKAQTDNKTAAQIRSLLSVEFLSGAETEPGIAYRFYGVDSQPQVVSITDNMEAYLQITDNQALSLQNQWGTSYTPTIKEGMLSLLTEGIRITGDVIK